ncbi:MAG: two-component sensor histidine kinase, partial [Nocardiopsis sp. BM-2018]
CTWSQAFVVPLIVVSYLAGRRTRRTRLAIAVFAVLCLVMAWYVLDRIEELPGLWITVAFSLVICTVLPWLVGVYRRQQVELGAAGWEHARQFQLEQQLTADRARLRER